MGIHFQLGVAKDPKSHLHTSNRKLISDICIHGGWYEFQLHSIRAWNDAHKHLSTRKMSLNFSFFRSLCHPSVPSSYPLHLLLYHATCCFLFLLVAVALYFAIFNGIKHTHMNLLSCGFRGRFKSTMLELLSTLFGENANRTHTVW